jgi:hypothetical protein
MSIRFDNMEQYKEGASDVTIDGGIGAPVGRSTTSNSSTGAGMELSTEVQT